MMKLFFILLLAGVTVFYSCSASTDTRYKRDKDDVDEEKVTIDKTPEIKIVEDFDFTPYKTKLNIPEKKVNLPVSADKSDIWYGYEETETDTSVSSNKKIIEKVQGYRVLLLTTDNLEEANNMKSEVYFNSNQKEVYVIFDPPFYKVMIGDFTKYAEANDLSFKMNQLGYTEARVVNETINIFE